MQICLHPAPARQNFDNRLALPHTEARDPTLIEAQGSAAASADAPRSDAASGRRLTAPATAAEATPCREIRARRRAAAAILFGRESRWRESREEHLVLRREELGGGESGGRRVSKGFGGKTGYLCERPLCHRRLGLRRCELEGARVFFVARWFLWTCRARSESFFFL